MTRVLAVRLDSAGDVLLAGPAIRALATRASHVSLLCGPRGRAAAELLPGVDDVLEFHAPWIDPEPEPVSAPAVDALTRAVAARAIDVALIFGSFHQSPLPAALILRLAGVRWIGAICEDYPGSLLDLRHAPAGEMHEAERALDLAAAAGFPLGPDDDGRLAVDHEPYAPAEPYVVVHPGASVSARAWSAERHAELVAALAGAGRRVLVTGAPDEQELTAFVAGPPRDEVLDLGGATGLRELAGVLAGADAVVVGNTGPAHLAAAVGTPVVSLFAPTVPAVRWRPYGVPHELLFSPVPCAGCRARECPMPGHPCLERVGPEDVLAALERLARARDVMGAPA